MSAHLPLRLIDGGAHPALARSLAHELGGAVAPAEVAAFADGETRAQLSADVRGTCVCVVQPMTAPVNDRLMALALLADAARAAGVARVVAVAPYLAYARQEVRSRPGDPRSAQVVAKLLGAVGIDHLVTLDLHAPALESAFRMPVTDLRADEALLPRVRAWGLSDLVVVSPDAGGMKRAQRFAAALGAGLAVVGKERPRPDAAAALQALGDVRGRSCLLVDDMASTGRTLAGAAETLRRAGAREVRAAFTHAVFAPGAAERIAEAGFAAVLTTDGIPSAEPWLEVVPVAPLLAQALRQLLGAPAGA